MKSYGSFNLEVEVPPGANNAKQRANDIVMLMREEVGDPDDFLPSLEETCKKVAEFLECDLELEVKNDKLTARFKFME
jgi:hypothetical protein